MTNLKKENKISSLVCVGLISGAHGIDGTLKIKSFCKIPKSIADYGSLFVGKLNDKIEIKIVGQRKELLRVKSPQVTNREKALELNGEFLFVNREELPDVSNDEYYYADLVGLIVKNNSGKDVGVVQTVQDYGGGEFLEIENFDRNDVILVPFTKDFIRAVSVQNNYLQLT